MSENKKVATPADRIREAMTDAEKKQADLVRATGLDKAAISSYLSGKYEPKQKAIGLLAIALDVNEMWLWGYDVPKMRTPAQKKNDAIVGVVSRLRNDADFFEVVSLLADLPPEQYTSVKTILAALSNK